MGCGTKKGDRVRGDAEVGDMIELLTATGRERVEVIEALPGELVIEAEDGIRGSVGYGWIEAKGGTYL
jgi:hypothetical protein